MKLYIGNKNYSSWSMRIGVLVRQFALPYEEVPVFYDGFGPDSNFKRTLAGVTPTGRVPVLVNEGFAVWDTLAIAEYLSEKFPQFALWPRDARQRARARSICAEMHAGFGALRDHCSQNLEAHLPEVGARVWATQAGVRDDVARLVAMWRSALAESGGPFLFGDFGIADAYFTPVAGRIKTYALPVPDDIAAYIDRLWAAPGVAAWVGEALAERTFVDFAEPYRTSR